MSLDSIYLRYINLDRRLDRDKDVNKKFIELGFNIKNIKRFSAIDGNKLINDLKEKNYIEDELIKNIQNINLNFKSCELACLLSHYFLLKEINNDETISDESFIFIFEDDFFINNSYIKNNELSNIINKLKLSEINIENKWDMIYFGGRFKENFSSSKNNISKFFSHSFDNFYLRINGSGADWDRTTHNYLIKKKNINNILLCILNNFNNNKVIYQIDSLFNSLSQIINMYDYFPHLFYSPMNYSTDIQKSTLKINSKNIK
jgi:GR25 family glycosyltransferase involved in LPS biosynthesis